MGEVEREVLTSLLCEECGGMVASKVMMVMMLMMVMKVMVVMVVMVVASKENASCQECGRELDENRFDEFRSAKKAVASLLRSQVEASPQTIIIITTNTR